MIEAPPLVLVEPSENEIKLHSQKLSSWYSGPENMHLTGSTTPVSAEETRMLLLENRAHGDRLFFIFNEGRLIGDADLRNINIDEKFAEFAILLGDGNCRGLGLGTIAAIAVHRFGFDILNLLTARLSVAGKNVQAIKSYMKIGYVEDLENKVENIESSPGDIVMELTAPDFFRRETNMRPVRISIRK